MKREIKFRGKRVRTEDPLERWIEGFYAEYTNIRDEKIIKIMSQSGYMNDINPETVGQFTGVKYNDREIYEHDLVECAGVLCEVVYSDKIGSFVLLEVLSQNLGNKPIGQMIDMFGIRYVGNIYDSPELLK